MQHCFINGKFVAEVLRESEKRKKEKKEERKSERKKRKKEKKLAEDQLTSGLLVDKNRFFY